MRKTRCFLCLGRGAPSQPAGPPEQELKALPEEGLAEKREQQPEQQPDRQPGLEEKQSEQHPEKKEQQQQEELEQSERVDPWLQDSHSLETSCTVSAQCWELQQERYLSSFPPGLIDFP